MAAFRILYRNKAGTFYEHVVGFDFDSSYPAGGEALTAANMGFDDHASDLFVLGETKGGIVVEYDPVNAKLKAYWGNAGTASLLPEVTATTDLSAIVNLKLIVRGRNPTAVTQGA